MPSVSGLTPTKSGLDRLVVIWIDWYPYHVARFRGLQAALGLAGQVVGIELVGGVGVHAGLKFREPLPPDAIVETLLPNSDWQSASQWSLAFKLWNTLRRLDPKTVLVPGYYTVPALAAALWARVYGRRSVLMTESTAADHARRGWKEKLKSLLIRMLFDWAVAGGTMHRKYLQQLGFPMERVVHCYDVVDNTFFETRARELRVQPAPSQLAHRYFLYIGRLSTEKNVMGLLQAWTEYRECGGTWTLVLVGSGPEETRLKQAAAQSGFAADIHFAGHKGSRDLPLYYAHAGCFVLPSTREPWGLVVNEALASSLPVIVSDRCGCAEDLVELDANGFRIDPGDRGEFVQVMQTMESLTNQVHTSMGIRSLQIIQRFSPFRFGEEIARIHRSTHKALASVSCDLAGDVESSTVHN